MYHSKNVAMNSQLLMFLDHFLFNFVVVAVCLRQDSHTEPRLSWTLCIPG